MTKRVAIQGIKGSFHHQVSVNYFSEPIDIIPLLSFSDVVKRLCSGDVEIGIIAIENSIAGSIIPNYALIDSNSLHITGEYYLEVEHHLMALNGQTIEDIKEVCSHPMALLQCQLFFEKYPHIKLVEDKDTAEVAKRIKEQKLSGVAAIASINAAKIYDLNILASNIQTINQNETRFVILERLPNTNKDNNKASIKFMLDHKRGSLAAMLNVMSDCKLNLTKIQSLPKIDTPWKYAFFVDVTFESFKDYEKAKSVMKIMAEEFKELGTYKNAKI